MCLQTRPYTKKNILLLLLQFLFQNDVKGEDFYLKWVNEYLLKILGISEHNPHWFSNQEAYQKYAWFSQEHAKFIKGQIEWAIEYFHTFWVNDTLLQKTL